MKVSEQTKQLLIDLGEKIKKARVECNMSQVELGDKIGVTRYTVGALENGRTNVAIGTVFEAAFVVGLPIVSAESDNRMPTISGNNTLKSVSLDDDYF